MNLFREMDVRYTLLYIVFFVWTGIASGQTQKDTLFAVWTAQPVVIDGSSADKCWSKTDWHPIDQVWMPYDATLNEGDFSGRFKLAWDEDYLYVLVEIVDDMISDDHSNPLQNWWDDDCLEVFIDENRSKGNHQYNNNAFAYHVSTKYDAIDLDSKGNGINYQDNIKVVMDTIGENTYLWELAIKIYDESFNLKNTEESRVLLAADKLMGFTIAYCDNDQTTSRENFIGSMYMTRETADYNYITADYFGSLVLSAKENTTAISLIETGAQPVNIYPNPTNGRISLKNIKRGNNDLKIEVYSLNGRLIKKLSLGCLSEYADLNDLNAGIYFLQIVSGEIVQYSKLMVQ